MSLTDERRLAIARSLATRMFRDKEAVLSVTDVRDAIIYVDDFFDSLPPELNASVPILQNMILGLPEPFKSNTDNAERALVAAVYFLEKGGILHLFREFGD